MSGRWINRDYVKEIYSSYNLYQIIYNNPIEKYDLLGLMECDKDKLGGKGDFSYSIHLYSHQDVELDLEGPIKQFFNATTDIISNAIEGKVEKTLEKTLDMMAGGAKFPSKAIESIGNVINKQGNIKTVVIEAKGKICCCDSNGGYKEYTIKGKATATDAYNLDPFTNSGRSLSKEAERLAKTIREMAKILGEKMKDINCDNKDESAIVNM